MKLLNFPAILQLFLQLLNPGTQKSLSTSVSTSNIDQQVHFHLHRLSQVHPQPQVITFQRSEYSMIRPPVSNR